MSKKSYRAWIVATAMTLLMGMSACGSNNADKSGSSQEGATSSVSAGSDLSSASNEGTEPTENSESKEGNLQFPIELEEGNLLIQSAFPSDIENPDCENAYVEGVASIELVNNSDDYLKSLILTAQNGDSQLTWKVEDLPAGQVIWAFDTENQKIDVDEKFEIISCEAVYGQNEQSVMNLVSTNTTDLSLQVTNESDEKLENLHVLCHADMGDAWFGGMVHDYQIEALEPGETINIDASDCLLSVGIADITEGY